MKRAPRGQQERLGCEAQKTKRMSKGEDEGDGNRKRQPWERLTFRVEARHASSGEIGKTKFIRMENLSGLCHKGFLSPDGEGARWCLSLGAAHPFGLVCNERFLPRAPKGCTMALRLSCASAWASLICKEDRLVRPESKGSELYRISGFLGKCSWAWVPIN